MDLSGSKNKIVRKWIMGICFIVVLIVLVGGVTRLTRSGLSMVDWRPIMGALPPIGQAEWDTTFEAYKQFPEYQKINYNMSLDEFKGIFFWEYFHRLLGRLLGLFFIIPWFLFVLSGRIKGKMVAKSFFGFMLGGGQGLLGWYMVKSGLVNVPHVSHYRLVAHLSLAIIIISYFYWLYLELKEEDERSLSSIQIPTSFRYLSIGFLLLVFTQIIYGGLVAGLKAGLVFNTFPKMHGSWFPVNAFTTNPSWMSIFDNHGLVQFVHRSIAWSIIFFAFVLFIYATKRLSWTKFQRSSRNILLLCLVQFGLGVATLLMAVPVSLASIHQVVAIILLMAVLKLNFDINRSKI